MVVEPPVIGHGDQNIAKWRDLLKLLIPGVQWWQTGTTMILQIFSKILTDGRSKQMADAPRYHTGILHRIAKTSAGKDPKIF
jgi:hypothetical protein